jgi:hypothetical protein
MRYALLIYSDQEPWFQMSEEEGGKELDDIRTAKTVRVRDGEVLVSDGPFAETKEQIGGLFEVTLPDLDTALEFAAKIPTAERGSIEVRPIVEH